MKTETKTDPYELTSGAAPYEGHELVSPDPNLQFADLFAEVETFDNMRGRFTGDTRGRYFTHVHRGWTAYAEPIGFAAEAARIETPRTLKGNYGHCSFELIPWPNGRTLVVCTPSTFIGSTWVAFIATDSIPNS